MFIWMFHFDNNPPPLRCNSPTILGRSALPLHIGIIGVLEGSQQIAIALYIFKNFIKLEKEIHTFCVLQNLDGITLRDTIPGAIKSLKLEDKPESKEQAALVFKKFTVWRT
jgi:hypothetical protein